MKLFIAAVSVGLLILGIGMIQNHFNTVPYNNCPITDNENGYKEYTCMNHVYYTR